MPVLTDLEKRIDSAPPKELPEEDSGDSSPIKICMVLVGVEKNQHKEIKEVVAKSKLCGCHFSDDLFKYNFAVLVGILEKYPANGVLELEDTDYLFLDKNNSPHMRSFEYSFLPNMNGKWHACLLNDEKVSLEKIRANKKITPTKEKPIEELMAELKVSISEMHGIKCTGNPLVFVQSYLGESPIRVYGECPQLAIVDKTRKAHSLDKADISEYREKHLNHWFFEERRYIAERFLPFESEFSRFAMLKKEDLPKEISNYHLMNMDGKEMLSPGFFFWKPK